VGIAKEISGSGEALKFVCHWLWTLAPGGLFFKPLKINWFSFGFVAGTSNFILNKT
jgi:hypothetical protein